MTTKYRIADYATIGEKYDPAMSMTEQADADDYFTACVEHNLRCCGLLGIARTREEAARVERINLGYYAGYFDQVTRARVERLFLCAHPVFGPVGGRA